MIDKDVDPGAMVQAEELLERFLVDRKDRTLQSYKADIDDFARFLDTTPVEATALLLGGGPGAGRTVALEYAVDLRRRDRAPATIDRRLNTLRALVRTAHAFGVITWKLDLPGGDEISAAMGRLPAKDSEHYLLPRHPSEIDRLDLQHYAIRTTLGAIHQAPLEAPALVLDVGAGTGQWGWDITAEFPSALVVGLDLVVCKPGWPGRYQPLRANLLLGLPFLDATFDFVHQRLLFLAIPAGSWQSVIRDLVRVTRPGGWIELVEGPIMRLDNGGPAIEQLRELALAAAAARGLDTKGAVYDSLDDYLKRAGVREVSRREVKLPIGEWGGQAGSLMATDFRSAFTRLLEARVGLGADERTELLSRVQEEYEERHVTATLGIVFGQKPA